MRPLRDKIHVTLEASPESHGLITRPATETPIRRVRVVAVGPEAEGRCEVGKLYLANILSGQQMGEDLVLPVKSLLAEWHED